MECNIRSLLVRVRIQWSRFQIHGCSRQLSSIASQRANDFEAERMLHRDLCVLRAELQKLSENFGEARYDPSPHENFHPRLVRFKKRGAETD